MAITKERLEELIKQNAKVWGIGKYNNVFYIGLRFCKGSLKNTEWYNNKLETYSKFFETKEEAEFALRYQNITRTETLSLPTWEEVQKRFKNNHKFGGHLIVEFDNIQLIVFIGNYSKKFIEITNYPRKLLTQENYLEACEICRKLFLGENV